MEPKHWSDIDSQYLFKIVLKLLTDTFASAPCMEMLRRHESWLRCNSDVIQDQLSSIIKQMRSRVDLGFDSCSPHLPPKDSHDPVTLVLLESKRKAFQMLVKLADAAGSIAPVSPLPAKVSRRCSSGCMKCCTEGQLNVSSVICMEVHLQHASPACNVQL